MQYNIQAQKHFICELLQFPLIHLKLLARELQEDVLESQAYQKMF